MFVWIVTAEKFITSHIFHQDRHLLLSFSFRWCSSSSWCLGCCFLIVFACKHASNLILVVFILFSWNWFRHSFGSSRIISGWTWPPCMEQHSRVTLHRYLILDMCVWVWVDGWVCGERERDLIFPNMLSIILLILIFKYAYGCQMPKCVLYRAML